MTHEAFVRSASARELIRMVDSDSDASFRERRLAELLLEGDPASNGEIDGLRQTISIKNGQLEDAAYRIGLYANALRELYEFCLANQIDFPAELGKRIDRLV